MLIHRVLFISAAVVLGAPAAALAQSVDTLDLTKMKPGNVERTGGVPVTVSAEGLSPHSVRETPPLTLSIKSLDRADYAYGQPFIIHLVLRNSGTQTITIPWEPDPERVNTAQGVAARTSALLSVLVKRGQGEAVALPLAVLYGGAASPMTVKVIRPGASVEVIADASWAFPWYSEGKVAPADAEVHPLSIGARLAFLTGIDGHVYRDVESVNKVKVDLRKSRRH